MGGARHQARCRWGRSCHHAAISSPAPYRGMWPLGRAPDGAVPGAAAPGSPWDTDLDKPQKCAPCTHRRSGGDRRRVESAVESALRDAGGRAAGDPVLNVFRRPRPHVTRDPQRDRDRRGTVTCDRDHRRVTAEGREGVHAGHPLPADRQASACGSRLVGRLEMTGVPVSCRVGSHALVAVAVSMRALSPDGGGGVLQAAAVNAAELGGEGPQDDARRHALRLTP